MFLPLAIALHTLDRQKWRERWEKSPTASEQAHLLRKQLPNTVCKVVLKFGVDISDPIPHLNTKDGAKKKLKMSTWMWHPNARCPTHRVKVGRYAAMQLTHLSRDVQRGVCCHFIEIQNHNEHSRTTPIAVAILKLWNLTKWSGCVGAWRRSSPVLIWSKFFSKPIFGFPDPGLHTVQSV